MYLSEQIGITRQYVRITYQRIAARHFRKGCDSPEVGWRKQKKGNEPEESTKTMLKTLKDVEIVNMRFKIFKILFSRLDTSAVGVEWSNVPRGEDVAGQGPCWGAAGAGASQGTHA